MALRTLMQRSRGSTERLCAKRYVNTVATATKQFIDPEWSTAKPYKAIPSPKLLAFAKEFKEGGKATVDA